MNKIVIIVQTSYDHSLLDNMLFIVTACVK